MKYLWILTLLIIGARSISAAEVYGVKIDFVIKGLQEGDKCKLAYYLGQKTYLKDSVVADASGRMTFDADTLKVGVYLVVVPKLGNSYVEFLVNEPKFTITTNIDALNEDVQSVGSVENALFFDHKKTMAKANDMVSQKNTSNTIKKDEEFLITQARQIVEKSMQEMQETHPNTLVANLYRAAQSVEVPPAKAALTELENQNFRYYYYRKHFWENISIDNDYLLYTNILATKLNEYLEKLTVQQPDSVMAAVDRVAAYFAGNESYFKFLMIEMVNKYAKSKMVCFDKVYVHIVDHYYKTGRASWVEATQKQKMLDNAERLRPSLCGTPAPAFTLPDVNGQKHTISSFSQPYTIIIFWSSGMENASELADVFSQRELLNSDGSQVQLIAVYLGEVATWKTQMAKYGSQPDVWLHLHHQGNVDQIREQYNLHTDFTIYLLDEHHNILLKKLSLESLLQYFGH